MKRPERCDLQDAVEHADVEGKHWRVDDFDLTFLGNLSVDDLDEYDDLSSWLDFKPGNYDDWTEKEKLAELRLFRGPDWIGYKQAKQWTATGIPPILVITTRDDEGREWTQIGDGRGRVNFASLMEMKVPVWHMVQKGADVATYARNPPWVDKILDKHFDKLVSTVGIELMPDPDLREPFSKSRKRTFSELGCGHYGCVFATATPGCVFKVTSDPTEAAFIAASRTLPSEDLPEGIVRYKGVWEIPGETYKRRPVFVIVREEAENVGGLLSREALQESEGKVRSVLMHLRAFKTWAAVARMKIQTSRKADILVEVKRWQRWADERVDWPDAVGPFAKPLPAGLTGAQAVAYALRAAHIVAEDMQNEDVGYLVGEALKYFLDEDLLLADVHVNNLGQVERPDYGGLIWVITDPGHMVPLSLDRWGTIHVPVL